MNYLNDSNYRPANAWMFQSLENFLFSENTNYLQHPEEAKVILNFSEIIHPLNSIKEVCLDKEQLHLYITAEYFKNKIYIIKVPEGYREYSSLTSRSKEVDSIKTIDVRCDEILKIVYQDKFLFALVIFDRKLSILKMSSGQIMTKCDLSISVDDIIVSNFEIISWGELERIFIIHTTNSLIIIIADLAFNIKRIDHIDKEIYELIGDTKPTFKACCFKNDSQSSKLLLSCYLYNKNDLKWWQFDISIFKELRVSIKSCKSLGLLHSESIDSITTVHFDSEHLISNKQKKKPKINLILFSSTKGIYTIDLNKHNVLPLFSMYGNATIDNYGPSNDLLRFSIGNYKDNIPDMKTWREKRKIGKLIGLTNFGVIFECFLENSIFLLISPHVRKKFFRIKSNSSNAKNEKDS